MEIREVSVTDVTVDVALQSRVDVRPDIVDEYAEALDMGAKFPPLRVCIVLGRMMLVDGYHRHAAYIRRELEVCSVEVVAACDMHEAEWHAIGQNDAHGLRRSNADKRTAVTRGLTRFPEKSHRAIAQQVGVSHMFVSNVWRDLNTKRDVETVSTSPEIANDSAKPSVRKDALGRLQPATKPPRQKEPEPAPPVEPPLPIVVPVQPAPAPAEALPEPPKLAEVDDYADHIRLLSRRMGAAFKGTHLESNGCFAMLKRAEDALRMSAPVDCPTCDGKGGKCRSCGGRGWVTRGDVRAVEASR
jgi:hypothetical protein